MEFVCNVLVVADQLLIPRLKEMCEVVITENRMLCLFLIWPTSHHLLCPIALSFHLEIILHFCHELQFDAVRL